MLTRKGELTHHRRHPEGVAFRKPSARLYGQIDRQIYIYIYIYMYIYIYAYVDR